jgi:hypothetical protein
MKKKRQNGRGHRHNQHNHSQNKDFHNKDPFGVQKNHEKPTEVFVLALSNIIPIVRKMV